MAVLAKPKWSHEHCNPTDLVRTRYHKSFGHFVDFNECLGGNADEVKAILEATRPHNAFLAELGLPSLP